jgi:voltage-gated potassium channel Kch
MAYLSVDKKLFAAFTLIFLYVVLGTLFYNLVEGWSYTDSFYYTAMTLTTVGYGDFTPATTTGKMFTVFFAFSGIGIVLYSLMVLARRAFEKQERRYQRFKNTFGKSDK